MVVLASTKLNTRSTVNPPSARSAEIPEKQTRKRITKKLRRKIVKYYEQGNLSALQTAEQFGVGKSTVLKILKQENATVRKHGQRIT